jgi:hypothetical protein
MNKNVLIRKLTAEQNERLEQLQKKFDVKTNSQALLMLLRYCIFLDDEINTLRKFYSELYMLGIFVQQKMEENDLNSTRVKEMLYFTAKKISTLEYLRDTRSWKELRRKMITIQQKNEIDNISSGSINKNDNISTVAEIDNNSSGKKNDSNQ